MVSFNKCVAYSDLRHVGTFNWHGLALAHDDEDVPGPQAEHGAVQRQALAPQRLRQIHQHRGNQQCGQSGDQVGGNIWIGRVDLLSILRRE